jgi:hypothetical protein
LRETHSRAECHQKTCFPFIHKFEYSLKTKISAC